MGGRTIRQHLVLSQPAQIVSEPERSAAPLRVILVIAAKLERLGWSIVVEGQDDMQLAAQFASCDDALAYLAGHRVDVALIEEGILTPQHCDVLRGDGKKRGTRCVLVGQHPIDDGLEREQYSFAARRLLKGVSADELLNALRRA